MQRLEREIVAKVHVPKFSTTFLTTTRFHWPRIGCRRRKGFVNLGTNVQRKQRKWRPDVSGGPEKQHDNFGRKCSSGYFFCVCCFVCYCINEKREMIQVTHRYVTKKQPNSKVETESRRTKEQRRHFFPTTRNDLTLHWQTFSLFFLFYILPLLDVFFFLL